MPNEYRISPEVLQLSQYPWILRNGIPAPIWIEYRKEIEAFVKTNKLQAIQREEMAGAGMDMPMETGQAMEKQLRLRPRPFPGGLRFAHVHFAGEVYRLDHTQWKSFSSSMLKDFRERLSRAETVSFDQLLDLSEATSTL